MSVTNDVQASLARLNDDLSENLAKASSEAERTTALLSNAVGLHGLFLKVKPFQQELTTSGAWKVVSDGELFAQAAVPSFLKLIAAQVKMDAAGNSNASILTSSGDEGPWAKTEEYLKELGKNLEENWDKAAAMIEQYEKDARDWYNSQLDWLDKEIRDFGKEDPGNQGGGKP